MEQELKKAAMLTRAAMQKVAAERVAEISREFTEGFAFLADYPKSVTFFGSTEAQPGDFYYEDARRLSARLVKELDYSVVSGGGPGIMEAADRGAYEAGGNAIGLLIDLPDTQPTNVYIKKSTSFYYFFARKVCLAFAAEAFIFYPGGFGTLDEFFELITLIQTRKISGVPLICVGSEYWLKLKEFMKTEMLKHERLAHDAILPSHLDLFTITDNHDEIIDIIKKSPVHDNIPFGKVAKAT